jgi:glycosyltransferase involved in cell wall biosynthesis
MKNNLVSVIIPCYNASDFISGTLKSILNQQKVNIEVVIINDGSTDDSEQKINSIADNRISYYQQPNSGVSSARNLGFLKSKGEYVIFFDADDLMTEDFIHSRLINIEPFDFICGEVKKFSSELTNNPGLYRGTGAKLVSEILLYDQKVVTCPSNYMFKAHFLKQHGLKFNTGLSSTADRYFLLECARFGKSDFIKECAALLYRVDKSSMSNLLSDKLVLDNEIYYRLLQKNGLIPPIIKDKSLFLGYYILSGANKKINKYFYSVKYGFMAFCASPLNFMKKIFQ